MIINIRGTSGSGKSLLVRRLMYQYGSVAPIYAENRRQPLGYTCARHAGDAGRPLFIIGHYETPCGGADTISMKGALDYIYGMVRTWASRGDVVVEGLIVESDVKRCAQLHADGLPLLVVGLSTPIEECLASAQARRTARGDDRPFNHANTINRVDQIKRRMERLQGAKVNAAWHTRESAFEACAHALGVTTEPGEWWPAPKAPPPLRPQPPVKAPEAPPGGQFNIFS